VGASRRLSVPQRIATADCIRRPNRCEGLPTTFVVSSFSAFVMSVAVKARIVLLALSPFVAACASLTSTTSIEPGKAFRLGGGQAGAFVVRGTNAGPVPIVVFSELAGKRDSVLVLAPGAPVDARFPKAAMAVFMNTSMTQTATVAIKVTGDISSLSMSYEQNPKR